MLAAWVIAACALLDAPAALSRTAPRPLWAVQIDYTQAHGVPWTQEQFDDIARAGMNGVEINLDWGDVEPQKGKYDFQLLATYLDLAARAHLQLYLIFWESVWREQQGKNPPPWLTARDVTSDGVTALQPPWWDAASRRAYFNYVARTIDFAKHRAGFGGIFANYGWLDAMWGPAPKGSRGVTGYAPADVQAFHRWLPGAYGSLADFNRRSSTHYDSWQKVPAARPGEALFGVYQRFRHESVMEAYTRLSRLVRAHTQAPLFYYWGGSIGGRGGPAVLGNDPDTFFKLAQRFHATVVFDDADQSGMALLFASLARDYRVPLLQEWTPRKQGLEAEIPQWLGHIGLGYPYEVGEDFFIYPPPSRPGYAQAWAAYQAWIPTLQAIITPPPGPRRSEGRRGAEPDAIFVPTLRIAQSRNLSAYGSLNRQLQEILRRYVLPHVITDQEIAAGLAHPSDFRNILDLSEGPASPPLLAKHATGARVTKDATNFVASLYPYVTLDPPSGSLEVVLTAHPSIVWLTLANCSGQQGYSGRIVFHPRAAGLRPGVFQVKDSKTHQPIAAKRTPAGGAAWHLQLPPGGFQVVEIHAGSGR